MSAAGARPALEKPLPANIDAERAVLGCVLVQGVTPEGKDALECALLHVNYLDFSVPQNRVIFRHAVGMREEGERVDLVTITERLFKHGDLDAAGGAPYVASLMDGSVRISNVEHYAKIVREKSKLREVIHTAEELQRMAWEPDADLEKIRENLTAGLERTNGHRAGANPLVAVDILDFMTMQLDPVEFMIEPILPMGNSAMIFSPSGAGKTYIMLYMAYCVAIGAPNCFVWDVPAKRPVCYVDAEMDANTLQERVCEIAKGWDLVLPERGMIRMITPDLQPKYPPRINTKEGRQRIEDHCTEKGLLVLDNLFTLCPDADSKETEDWAVIQEWILHLRRKRVAVFIVQHSNRSGDQQYGTSKREVQLACNLMLRNATNYTPEEGLKVEARLKKLRRRGLGGRWQAKWGQPFEIAYRVDNGAAVFTTRPMTEILKKRAIEMLLAGMRENDVAQELGLDRFKIYRLKKKIREDGAQAATEAE